MTCENIQLQARLPQTPQPLCQENFPCSHRHDTNERITNHPEGSKKPRAVGEGRQEREMERPEAEGGSGKRGGRVEGGVRGQRPHVREIPHGEPNRPQCGRGHKVQARELSLSHRRGVECVPRRVEQVC